VGFGKLWKLRPSYLGREKRNPHGPDRVMTKPQQISAARSGKAQSELLEQRTRLVKEELDFERAASVAKTMKLKALRLEKTRVDAEQEFQTNRFIPTVVTDPRQGGR
jgi:hypothetical protein